MKSSKLILSGAIALGLAAAANAQITNTTFNNGGPGQGYTSGDLILGFYNPGGTSPDDLGVDLGAVTQFEGLAAGTYTVTAPSTPAGSLATDLTAAGLTLGANTNWTVSGGNVDTNEVFVTSTGATLNATSNQVLLAGNLDNDIGGSVSNAAGTGTAGSFDGILFNKNIYTDIGAANWSGTYTTTVARSTVGTTSLTLWDLVQTTSGIRPGVDLGTFTFNAATDALTFTPFTAIPEPSTYAAILGALSIGFVMIRRRFGSVAFSV
jgi:hypothetical protein